MSDTIIPRLGVVCYQTVTFEFSQPADLDERELANIEADINERFGQVSQMGTVEKVFQSNVTASSFLGDHLTVMTDAESLRQVEVEDMEKIVRERVNVPVSQWEITSNMSRKSMAPDFV